jgi:hypothetical protein
MPQLWSQLSVAIGRVRASTPQPSFELIKIWISRSGSQLLSLVVQDLGHCDNSVAVGNDLLRIFAPHMRRWQRITLILPNHPFPGSLTGLEGGAHLLRSAQLEFHAATGLDVADSPQTVGLSQLLTSSSLLHTLYWRNDLSILYLLDVPWAQLTVIDLMPLWRPMAQIVRILREAPMLRSLSVFITQECLIPEPLSLSQLAIFWIGAEVDLRPLFRHLTLSSLLKINVFCSSLVPGVPQPEVTDCIIRSRSPIDTAVLKSLRVPKPEFINFLRASSSLLLLEISNDGEGSITDDILFLLTANDMNCLCPNLRIVRFLESSISSSDGVLADMVASRQRATQATFPVAELSRLVVEFSEADMVGHGEDVRRLSRMEKEGPTRVWINQPETE